MSVEPSPRASAGSGLSGSAALVAAGMLISKIAGYVRVTLFSYYFGVHADAADAFNAAIRIPNTLQNLLGDGVLSASLIPVYARLLKTEHQGHADEVARTVLALLAVVASVIVLVGIIFAPQLVHLLAYGFVGAKRDLTVHLVRILFPGIALLVMSAWCLAILNSHGKFFLSYVAPVVWNASILTALVWNGHKLLSDLAVDLAWAASIGCGLQLGVQLPGVWRIMAAHWSRRSREHTAHVRTVLLSALPVIFTRGVVQISAFIDGLIVSLLPTGATTALAVAIQLYQLPVGLFGQAVSSAELPKMSMANAATGPEALRERMIASQKMIAVLIVPSMFAFLFFGDVMIGMLLEHGKFHHDDTLYVWAVLAGSAVGLMAGTIGRLYANAFYALGDTRTPTMFAMIRIGCVAAFGWIMAIPLPRALGIPPEWGTVGLTASAGISGWIEFSLLRRALRRRIGGISISVAFIARTWGVAITAALVATSLRWILPPVLAGGARFRWEWLVVRGLTLLGVYGTTYLALAQWAGLSDFREILGRVLRRRQAARRRA